jgi:hypothetical protein
MKHAYWGYWLIVLGIFVVVVMLLVQSVTATNTQDYYMIKEVTQSAMVDSVDYAYYRDYGEIKINKEKFMECFVRRMAEETNVSQTYKIEFYQIYEAPPKVSVKVSSRSNSFNIAGTATDFDVVNKVDAILEGNTDPNS